MPPMIPKRMAPVLLLGEPTEINPSFTKVDSVNRLHSKPQINKNFESKVVKSHNKQANKFPTSPFKDPFDIKKDSVQLREAVNTGFKSDTLIVESGFVPIFNKDDIGYPPDLPDDAKPGFARRSDNFDESEENDDLLTNEEGPVYFESSSSDSFEPPFIPSPLDSPQGRIALPLINNSNERFDMQADASEKQFTYLPPESESKHSAVTYDAKNIYILNNQNPIPSQNDFVKLSSKTKQWLKETPQTVPFQGELPIQLSSNNSREKISAKLSRTAPVV
jgi:hypothetical protein